MPISLVDHWQRVYRRLRTDDVSWFAPHLSVSISLLKRAGIDPAT